MTFIAENGFSVPKNWWIKLPSWPEKIDMQIIKGYGEESEASKSEYDWELNSGSVERQKPRRLKKKSPLYLKILTYT
jgi:hypothetical protein